MIKKILIIAFAMLMIAGCKKNSDNKETPEPSAAVTATQSAENSESDSTESPEKTDDSGSNTTAPTSAAPLTPPPVDSAKKDPERTASIPETPPPDKVITTAQETAGAGSRSEEVSNETVAATSVENAIILAKQYMKNNNIYIPTYVELDRENDEYYYIHAYEVMNVDGAEHTASVGWFDVNKKTSEVTKGSENIKVGKRPEAVAQ